MIKHFFKNGSLLGGTNVTIIGDGFNNQTTVIIGDNIYTNGSGGCLINYNNITLPTLPCSEKTYPIHIYVNNTKSLSNGTMTFTCSEQYTPVVTSIYPESINGSGIITLIGYNFGNDSSQTTIYIGNQSCVVQTVNSTYITCLIGGVETGNQSVTCNIGSIGNVVVPSNITLVGVPLVSTVSPPLGGCYGGQVITITGNGFSDNTTVYIGPIRCKVISVSVNDLKCVIEPTTVPYPDGNYTIDIWYGNDKYTGVSADFTFDSTITPNLTSLYPSSGSGGDTLTIDGYNFGLNMSHVKVLN